MASSERRELIRELTENGWVLLRQKGSHCQYVHPDRPDKITVPFKVKKNIELSVRRQMYKLNGAK